MRGKTFEHPFGLLALQTPEGLLFWPLDDVACLVEEYHGRIAAVSRDGTVAHRPGPLPHGPWIPIAPGVLAHPAHLRRQGDRLCLPGGWDFPAPAGPLPTAPHAKPEAADPLLSGTAMHASDVLYLEPHSPSPTWVTRGGPVRAAGSTREALRAHPALVRAGRCYVNPQRIRAINLPRGPRATQQIRFDGGRTLQVASSHLAALARAFGLPSLDWLEPLPPEHGCLYRERLRDFPSELLRTPAADLRAAFGDDARAATANVVWQAVRYRAAGTPKDYGTDERGFWYLPLLPVLVRLHGVHPTRVMAAVGPAALAALQTAWCSDRWDPFYQRFLDLLSRLVGKDRLFTYRELGFDDHRPDLRAIGSSRPTVVLLVEKASLLAAAREIARRFGVSFIVMGGSPKYVATEFFVAALGHVGAPLEVVAFVDFDPEGWSMPPAFVRQLARYGVQAACGKQLVRPSRFSAQEIEYLAEPIEVDTPVRISLLRHWMAETGGIGGKPFRLHANHLTVERAVAAFAEETGLGEVAR